MFLREQQTHLLCEPMATPSEFRENKAKKGLLF